MTGSGEPFRGIRRSRCLLLLLMAALGTAGFLTGSMWFLGLAAWVLVAVGLVGMIYPPQELLTE